MYSQPPKAQLAYGALLGGRVSLILNCNDQLKRGLTVAIRYCAVRRQFANKPGAPETQILDYQTHQIRLLEPLWYLPPSISHGSGRNSPVGVYAAARSRGPSPGAPWRPRPPSSSKISPTAT